MERNILFLINPISGKPRKSSPEKAIAIAAKKNNIKYSISPTDPSGNYVLLAERIKKEAFTDIVICGGDGTVNKVLFALLNLNTNVNIGIIPLGSGNGLAFAAKIPKQFDKALKIVFSGSPSLIDAFYINDRFSCMLSGLGFDAQVAHDFALQKKRGLVTYIQQTLKNFIKAPTYSFEIIIDGRSFSTEAFCISIANSNQFGNNFKIAPKAILDDGMLDIIVMKKMSKHKLVGSVIRQLYSGHVKQNEALFDKGGIIYLQADKIEIKNFSLAPMHIDGDPVETMHHLNIQIIPSAFRLLTP